MSGPSGRELLADTLAALLEAIVCEDERPPGLRVSKVALGLPVEVAVAGTGLEAIVLVNPARWRWTTKFDQPLSRLSFRCHQEATP